MSRVGSDVSVAELLDLYDAVILAIGAPHDRKLGIPGEDLPGVVGSAEFVGWYNGHPDFADLDPPLGGTHAAVIGNGNVALDCARILSKTRDEFEGSDIVGHALDALDHSAIRTITILGRRGPHQIAMTPKELGELGHLEAAVADRRRCATSRRSRPTTRSSRAMRKSVTLAARLRRPSARPTKPKRMVFDFFAKPLAIEGDGTRRADHRRAHRARRQRRRARHRRDLRGARVAGRSAASAIRPRRSRTSPMTNAAASSSTNAAGSATGSIAVGWARRGPTGTIGTNRPDGYEVADQIAAACRAGSGGDRAGARRARSACSTSRGVMATDYDDWRKIEETETANARPGSPREKFVRHRPIGSEHGRYGRPAKAQACLRFPKPPSI